MRPIDWNRVDVVENPRLLARRPYDGQVAHLVERLLAALGEDPEREGLRRTPERVARMFDELLAGYDTDPVALVNGAMFATEYEGIVLVRDIEFYSLCEHHLLPFYGHVHVAYVPDGKVLGLSKIPRTVDMFARRLQLQERMTQQIADFLEEVIRPKGVAVLAEASHLCSMMRGVQKSDARMMTSVYKGQFKTDASLRKDLAMQLQVASLGGVPDDEQSSPAGR
jgi:GTP cyclohydrolase I